LLFGGVAGGVVVGQLPLTCGVEPSGQFLVFKPKQFGAIFLFRDHKNWFHLDRYIAAAISSSSFWVLNNIMLMKS
jgi:hypothetical protein